MKINTSVLLTDMKERCARSLQLVSGVCSAASVTSLADKSISRDTVTCYVKLVGWRLMKWVGTQICWEQTEN